MMVLHLKYFYLSIPEIMKEREKFKILFVDDEPASLTAFKSLFRDDYDIHLATSADEAYKIMNAQPIDIVISDQRMPGITGVEFLQKVRVEFPETVRMLITGYSDIDAVIRSINASMVSYYFSKPFNEMDMKTILDNTIERIILTRENRKLVKQLQQLVEELQVQKANLEEEIIKRKKAENERILAQKQAEESSRLKSSLLLNLNHEFRTPMNSILGFAQIMKESLSDEEFKKMAEIIGTSGKRLIKTLNSIIELARYEADKKLPDIEKINMSKVTKDVLTDFREIAERKNLVLHENILPDVFVLYNHSFAQLIITNLIDNAIKFTNEGFIRVTIDKEISGDAEYAVLKVKDSGIGIQKIHHETVFEEFRQVSEGYSRSYEGLGIGLALCKKLLIPIHGEIFLESEIGKGTQFTVRIPLLPSDQVLVGDQLAETKKRSFRSTVAPERTVAKKLPYILVVEDNENNAELMDLYLKDTCRIAKAYDGESAVQIAAKERFDAILMDINLGTGIDGVEALIQIRKAGGNDKTPVIAVTGYSNIEDKHKFLSTGFHSFIPKPFTRQDLLTVINKSLLQ